MMHCIRPPPALPLLLPFVPLLVACSDDAEFTTKYASDFAPAQRHAVSVFGLFKDGRMSGEAWEQFGALLSRPLGGPACEAEYGGGFEAANQDLAAAVDDYTRDNGPTDDLLAQFAPLAQGDAILVYTMAGHPPQQSSAETTSVQAPPPTSTMRGGMGAGSMGPSPRRPPQDTNVFEISAAFYSVAAHKSEALVLLRYTGKSTDDAVARFTSKLAAEAPATKCVGWKQDAKVDPEAIRKLSSP
jgi:hypothetical protein